MEFEEFNTELIKLKFEMLMTMTALKRFEDVSPIIRSVIRCTKKCNSNPVSNGSQTELEALHHCVKDCETGFSEALRHQKKSAEISNLTYSKNMDRCLALHNSTSTELLGCFMRQTDKVERRFFGYYFNQRYKLLEKYT